MTEFVYDFSPEAQKVRYQEFYTRFENQEAVLSDHIRQTEYLYSLGFDTALFGGADIVDIGRSLGTRGVRVYNESEFASRLFVNTHAYVRIMKQPSLLLNLPDLPPMADSMDLRLMLNLDNLSDDENLRRSAPTLYAYNDALDMINRFGFPLSVRYNELMSLVERLEEAVNDAVEILYMRFVVHEAVQLLVAKCPDLSGDLEHVVNNLVLLKTGVFDRGDIVQAIDGVGNAYIDGMHFITYQLNRGGSYLDNDHSFRVLAMAHELTHAVVAGRMQEPSLPLDYMKQATLGMADKRDVWMIHQLQAVNAYTVIQESASLFFERELMNGMNLDDADIASIHKIQKFLAFRRTQLHDYAITFESHPSKATNVLRYTIGWEIVKSFRKHGWAPWKFSRLLDQIIDVINRSDDSDEPTAVKALAIDYSEEADSAYQKFLRQVLKI